MKKIALVLCVLVTVMCLFGCRKTEEVDYSNDKSWADVPQYSEGYPTADDIATAYNAANTAFGWMALTSVPPLDREDTYVVDNVTYYRVDVPYIQSLSDLELYYNTLFDADTVQMLMEVNGEIGRFIENPDGGIYCIGFTYTPEGYSEEEVFTVTKNSDTSYTYSVAYHTVDEEGNKKHDHKENFKFEKVDGRWIFVDFYVYRQ
jgi:hypothetical protein